MAAGRLGHFRLSFQQRSLVSDGYGNNEGDFEEVFRRWAQVRPSAGVETVTAARLQGRQPVDITVRRDSETLEIEADWQAVDVATGTIYAIRSPAADVAGTRLYLVMKAESGVAA